MLFVRFDPARPPRLRRTRGLGLTVLRHHACGRLDRPASLTSVVLAAAILPRADAVQTGRALDIPLAADGFAQEWEAKTRAFASLEPGVFLCGLAHGPKPLREVISQALAAGQQALVLLSLAAITPGGTVASVDAPAAPPA